MRTKYRQFRLRFVTEGEEGGGQDGAATGGEFGFPAETPVAEMTAEQQAAYWKYHSKKWERNAKAKFEKPADYDQVLADAQAYRQQKDDAKSPNEKAVDQARAAGKAEALQEILPTLVRAEFARRLPHLDDDALEELLEDVSPATYFKDGAVDTERVARMAKRLAPQEPQEDEEPGGTPLQQFNLGHVLAGAPAPKKGTSTSIEEAQARTLAKYQPNTK
ncbi:hypothetical protein MUN77_01675 [Leucobacter allii]|uniref:hypothetical protein n=1 Tax=Leucobacter allii TaxID=2932247 RepID=UPI001FD4133C|nr:hypothetical protein [Leucobacter allii]UOR02069.1 hypothetical protein MUN77_01675 [Leucobacter allii]